MSVQPNNLNDLRPDLERARELTVSVVIPAYNRGAMLARTLESLAGQRGGSPKFDIHVGDDGSEEDLRSVVESATGVAAQYHRRDRDRFGAGQARNLAAREAEGDVLVFLDSDCIVGDDFIIRHASWHASGERTVLIGGRNQAVMGSGDDLTDYRKRLRRRTSGLQVGNEIFRSFVTANVSLPRRLFWELGGFDERFHRWGGEDTELGWRLWNSGATFLDDESIAVMHQVEEDPSGGEEGRRRSHQLNMGLIASLIPHRFYRKDPPAAIPEVPKVSVVVHDVPPGSSIEMWKSLLNQRRTDFEMIVVADDDDEEPLAGASVGDPRLSFTPGLEEAVDRAHGEYTCFLNGHAAPGLDLLVGTVRRLDKQPTRVTATVGYALPDGDAVRSENGARDIDRAWESDMPLCWFIRTRELTMLRREGNAVSDVWPAAKEWALNLHWNSAAVRLPGSRRTDRPRGFEHRSATRQELATDVVTKKRSIAEAATVYMLRRRERPAAPDESPKPVADPGTDERPSARYVGWSGHYNLGDEVMLDAVRGLLDWTDVETTGDPGRLLILGGGTLINRSSYLKQVSDRDTPRIERCVLGTGVASPDYWGQLEDPTRWARWISSCAYVGVRGPHSLERLRDWGYEGEAEVSGDSALLIDRPDVGRTAGKIVIAPAWTKGELWGGSDEDVVRALAKSVKIWHEEGRDVVAVASSPDDDGVILRISQEIETLLPFVRGYLDSEAAIDAIAGAEAVVGERLHACVLAAAVSTPFVAVEYRPKLRDFAASVGVEHLVVRSDEISAENLVELTRDAISSGTELTDQRVDSYRKRLRAASSTIRRAVLG